MVVLCLDAREMVDEYVCAPCVIYGCEMTPSYENVLELESRTLSLWPLAESSGGRQRPRLMVLTATFPSAKARHETCQRRLYVPAQPPLGALGRVCDTSPFRRIVQSKKNI